MGSGHDLKGMLGKGLIKEIGTDRSNPSLCVIGAMTSCDTEL